MKINHEMHEIILVFSLTNMLAHKNCKKSYKGLNMTS